MKSRPVTVRLPSDMAKQLELQADLMERTLSDRIADLIIKGLVAEAKALKTRRRRKGANNDGGYLKSFGIDGSSERPQR